jgi:hypothetical protein
MSETIDIRLRELDEELLCNGGRLAGPSESIPTTYIILNNRVGLKDISFGNETDVIGDSAELTISLNGNDR